MHADVLSVWLMPERLGSTSSTVGKWAESKSKELDRTARSRLPVVLDALIRASALQARDLAPSRAPSECSAPRSRSAMCARSRDWPRFEPSLWLEDLPQSWQLPTGIPVPTDPVSMIDPLPAGHGMSWQIPTRCPAATRYAGFCGGDPI